LLYINKKAPESDHDVITIPEKRLVKKVLQRNDDVLPVPKKRLVKKAENSGVERGEFYFIL